MTSSLANVARQFTPQNILEIQAYGSGNVNDTFLVTHQSPDAKPTQAQFILQRVNTRVFERPELIMQNVRVLSRHIVSRKKQNIDPPKRRWELPSILSTRDNEDYLIDATGSFWRAMSFIEDSNSYTTVQSVQHAREAGRALGRFHHLVSDLDVNKLHDTLEGFHITPQYLQQYDTVRAQNNTVPEDSYCIQFVAQRREWASVLENAKAQNRLSMRTIHGDPKISNIMIDETTGQAVSIVDLDTVKPGLIHYDIGDCLRSCCNPLGEETTDTGAVCFDLDLCQAILQGYLNEADDFLDANDYAYLYDSVRLISFELGLRFFTDYLASNRYFKVEHEQHNLNRAVVQFKLVESIEAQVGTIKNLIEELSH